MYVRPRPRFRPRNAGGVPFSPALLFTSGAAGVWYDPSDINNYMAGLGPELVTNGDFSSSSSWTLAAGSGGSATISGGALTLSGGTSSFPNATQSTILTSGKYYSVTVVMSSAVTSGSLALRMGGGTATYQLFTSAGTYTLTLLADGTDLRFIRNSGFSDTAVIDSISVKEVTGIANATLFQDSAGTTPVTAVEQPVGLMLDKSQGLVTATVYSNDGSTASGWTYSGGAGGSIVSASGKLVLTCATTLTTLLDRIAFYALTGLTSGATYKVTAKLQNISDSQGARLSVTQLSGTGDTTGVYVDVTSASLTDVQLVFVASATTMYLRLIARTGNSNAQIGADDILVVSLAGNHASQATAASRPVLRARYNLLTYSEQFDNAAWTTTSATVSANTTATTDPLGGNTADSLIASAASSQHRIYQAVTSSDYTLSVYAKAGTASFISLSRSNTTAYATFNLSTGVVSASAGGTATIQNAGNGWWRCAIASTVATSYLQIAIGNTAANAEPNVAWLGAGENVYVWGAQAVTGSSAGTYQRIAAATDYATAGFDPYLAADGVDDFLAAAYVQSAYPLTLAAGINNDSISVTFGAFVSVAQSDTVYKVARDNAVGATDAQDRNTSTLTTGGIIQAGNKFVLTQFETSLLTQQVNSGTANTTANTNAFGTSANIFLGKARPTNLFSAAKVYGVVITNSVLSASQISSLRSWMGQKMGVTL